MQIRIETLRDVHITLKKDIHMLLFVTNIPKSLHVRRWTCQSKLFVLFVYNLIHIHKIKAYVFFFLNLSDIAVL